MKGFLPDTMEGVVLQTYGAGNGPDSRDDLLAVFKEASDRGVIFINITQCSRGTVSVSYAAGKVGPLETKDEMIQEGYDICLGMVVVVV